MDSSPTLQDFVLNLIYDPAARSAFQIDPESALHAAGLGDVTAADVRQVIPLVVDSAPVTGLHGLAPADDLTTGVASLDVAGAVSQLQAITSQVTGAPGPLVGDLGLNNALGSVNAAVISVTGDNVLGGSVLSGNSIGLAGLSGLTSAVPAGLGGLTAGNDPGLHLDNGVVSPVEHTVSDVVPAADHLLPGVGGTLDAVVNLHASVPLDHAPELDGAGAGAATSLSGSLVRPDLGHLLPHDPVNEVHTVVNGIGGAGHDAVAGVLHGVTHPAGDTSQGSTHDLLGDLHL